MDPQGTLVLPAEWRREIWKSGEVVLVKGQRFIKLIPKRKPDLRRFFDSADLGVHAGDDWPEFEKKIHRPRR